MECVNKMSDYLYDTELFLSEDNLIQKGFLTASNVVIAVLRIAMLLLLLLLFFWISEF